MGGEQLLWQLLRGTAESRRTKTKFLFIFIVYMFKFVFSVLFTMNHLGKSVTLNFKKGFYGKSLFIYFFYRQYLCTQSWSL